MFEITAIFHSIKIVKLLLLFMYGSFIFITFFDIDVSCYVNRIWKNIVKKGPNVYCISNRCTIKSVTNSGSLKPQYSKQVRQTLFVHYRIIHYIKCNMLSKSSKWELGKVHYVAKFTISRFVISRFRCISLHKDCIIREWNAFLKSL